MSITEAFIKLLGCVLALVGLLAILSALHVGPVEINFVSEIWSAIIGVLLLIMGVFIVRGKLTI